MATDSNVTDDVADYTVLREKLNIISDSIQSGFTCMQHTVRIIQNSSTHPLNAESVLNTNTIRGLDITTKVTRSEPGMLLRVEEHAQSLKCMSSCSTLGPGDNSLKSMTKHARV